MAPSTIIITSDPAVVAAVINAAPGDLLKAEDVSPIRDAVQAPSVTIPVAQLSALALGVKRVLHDATPEQLAQIIGCADQLRLGLSIGNVAEVRQSFEQLVTRVYPCGTSEQLRFVADALGLSLYRSSESVQRLAMRLAYRYYSHLGD